MPSIVNFVGMVVCVSGIALHILFKALRTKSKHFLSEHISARLWMQDLFLPIYICTTRYLSRSGTLTMLSRFPASQLSLICRKDSAVRD